MSRNSSLSLAGWYCWSHRSAVVLHKNVTMEIWVLEIKQESTIEHLENGLIINPLTFLISPPACSLEWSPILGSAVSALVPLLALSLILSYPRFQRVKYCWFDRSAILLHQNITMEIWVLEIIPRYIIERAKNVLNTPANSSTLISSDQYHLHVS